MKPAALPPDPPVHLVRKSDFISSPMQTVVGRSTKILQAVLGGDHEVEAMTTEC